MHFQIFQFHEIFDGLLGIDTLKQLDAIIDLNNALLRMPNINLKLHCLKPANKIIFNKQIPKQCISKFKFPVNIKEGEIMVEQQDFFNCFSHKTIKMA